ncbi:putative transposase [Methylobacterium nodulans ORS 2060]|uniref:Putative transposase n=1 Tax=Methylobacterium nodulans (strain LMG 21967 / CNCM I-2342 / ORS 2060) TaxID=460265 RepID=B8IVA5_METNO|nr:putative transposase [Methylobacterium nodulans ORS 2060]
MLASGTRAAIIAPIRALLAPTPSPDRADLPPARDKQQAPAHPCCGGRLLIVERFRCGETPRLSPIRAVRIDTS